MALLVQYFLILFLFLSFVFIFNLYLSICGHVHYFLCIGHDFPLRLQDQSDRWQPRGSSHFSPMGEGKAELIPRKMLRC